MPYSGKPVYLRGGMSAPTCEAGGDGPFSSSGHNSSSSFMNSQLGASVNDSMTSLSFDSNGISWNPRHSMAFNSAKGLLNPVGENNCFLNCAVQVLWHLDVFRRNFRLLSGHVCLGGSCVFCALKAVFTQYQYSERSALPSDSLRRALANTFAGQQRFQMGLMDDASECFENILLRVHHHVAPDHSEDNCQAPHCLPHRKFSMKVKEQVVCQCRIKSGELSFDQMVHYIATTSLMTQVQHSRSRRIEGRAVSFGQLLKDAKGDGETRKCSSNCGRYASIRRTLTTMPEVISIGFIWDSDRPSFEHIRGVVSAINIELRPHDLFDAVSDPLCPSSMSFQLVGVVCYFCRHYSTFFFHSKMKTWVLFDDARIIEIGPNWRSVADHCCQGHYQPLLLLYAKPDATPLDTTKALQTTVIQNKPECYWKYRKHYSSATPRHLPCYEDGQSLPGNQYNEDQHSVQSDLSSMRLTDSSSTLSSFSSESTTKGRKEDPRKTLARDESAESNSSTGRQPSYLFAITGMNSYYKDDSYASYVAALDNASSSVDFRQFADRTNSNSMMQNPEQQGRSVCRQYGPPQVSTRSGSGMPDRKFEALRIPVVSGRRGTTDDAIYHTIPHPTYSKCAKPAHLNIPQQSHDRNEEWNARPATSADGGRPLGVSSRMRDAVEISNRPATGRTVKHCSVTASPWLDRIDEDDGTTGSQYINAKKVQSILASQGMKGRRIATKNPAEGIQKMPGMIQHPGHHDGQRVGHKMQSANCYEQMLNESIENASIGSQKESGYRSGESNTDRSSPSSVVSSTLSVDSGEFILEQNAQMIAEGFKKAAKQEKLAFTTSVENVPMRILAQENGSSRMPKTQVTKSGHRIDNYDEKILKATSRLGTYVPQSQSSGEELRGVAVNRKPSLSVHYEMHRGVQTGETRNVVSTQTNR